MRIFRGVVRNNSDITKTGKLTVEQYHRPEIMLTVTYASPYYTRHEGGLLAIPEIGSEILFLFDEDFSEYYYLSTLVCPTQTFTTKTATKENLIPEKKLYNDNDVPQAITFKDSKGSGLKVSNYYSKIDSIGPRVQLNTWTNHKLLLSDSPEMDCVILRNKDFDGITITSRPNNVHSANSIETKSKGAQRCIVRESEYQVVVADGKDITFLNNSTGAFQAFVEDGQPKDRQYGNINLISKNKDINIWTEGADGNILITTPKVRLQINSDGSLDIISDSDVNIKTQRELNLKGNKINIESDTEINLNGQSVNIKGQGGNVKIQGDSGTSIGFTGIPLQLNPVNPSLPSIESIHTIDLKFNAYGK